MNNKTTATKTEFRENTLLCLKTQTHGHRAINQPHYGRGQGARPLHFVGSAGFVSRAVPVHPVLLCSAQGVGDYIATQSGLNGGNIQEIFARAWILQVLGSPLAPSRFSGFCPAAATPPVWV